MARTRVRRSLRPSELAAVLHCSGFGELYPDRPDVDRERDTLPAPPPCSCKFPTQSPSPGKEWTHAPGCEWAAHQARLRGAS